MNEIELFNIFPYELCDIIFSFIPDYKKIGLNKTYFRKYHHLLKKRIINNRTEDYIRDILRRDNDFVFTQLLKENSLKWKSMLDYYYDALIFHTYIHFLHYYSDEHGSYKCKNVLHKYLKNEHKKNLNEIK